MIPRGSLFRAVRNLWFVRRCDYSTDGVVKSPYGEMKFPNGRVHECFYEKFEKYSGKTAVECSVTGRKYTYGELRKLSGILACAMQNKLKLEKGDSVAVCMPNMPEYPMLLFAGSECGVATTTVSPNYTPGEIAHQLKTAEAKVVFTTVDKYGDVEAALKSLQKTLPVVVVKERQDSSVPSGAANFSEFLDASTCGHLRKVDGTGDDVFVLPFSSGTTGVPKGIELMHRNIIANVNQFLHVKGRIYPEGLEDDVVLSLLPIYHIYGMTIVAMSTLYSGGHMVTMPRFEPSQFVETVQRKKVSFLPIVPPIVLFLTNSDRVTPDALKSVRLVNTGGAPLGHGDIEKFADKWKNAYICQGFGMTETSPVVLFSTKERFRKYGGCGVPVISTEVKIVDTETHKPLGVNQRGELWVKGPQVMKGYYNNKKETDEAFVDGWLRTGDVAYYDQDGDFFISDRIKELIKVNGLQVAPAELEEILRSHPKIAEAAVIGVKHPSKGEVPKAFVVLRKGETAKEEEIKDFVKGKVAKYKELDGGVVFREAIPKSAPGKILRKELK